ncbi:MAG: ACP S-malonyltransferase [Agarilytica sp.]
MNAILFPGQGSQHLGMGNMLFDTVPEFTDLESEVDTILGYSARDICLNNPENKLKKTQYTQPCLYIVNALNFFSEKSKGLKINYLAGHSLGEYNALLAAGAFNFITGLTLVKKRGELMSQAKQGGMAAVIGMKPETICNILESEGISDVTLANYNSSSQIVVAGLDQEIQRASPILEKSGAKLVIPLPVSGAFHSKYMADAETEFSQFLSQFEFNELLSPVISNVTGAPYPLGDATNNIREHLVKQICQPVKWHQSITYLLKRKINIFHELGPGDVLTKLVNQITTEYENAPAEDMA